MNMRSVLTERSSNTYRELVESLVAADLAARQEGFFRDISELVARLAATGNRYSTALVAKMEDAGRGELHARAEKIQASWKRVLSIHPDAGGSYATADALVRLTQERESIEGVVLSVQMGSVPLHPGFLSEAENLLRKRLLAELQLSDPAASCAKDSSSDEIVEVRPNFFGLGLNLRALYRRIAARLHR